MTDYQIAIKIAEKINKMMGKNAVTPKQILSKCDNSEKN